MTPPEPARYAELESLLRERLEVIADHAWRDRDPETHLEALRNVSLRIGAAGTNLADLPPRLQHFLAGCSYDKALAFVEESHAAQGSE